MDKLFNSAYLVNLIGKWRIHLLVIMVITVVLSAIFSGPSFITPLYESHAIAYPANIEPYSDESETEQMLQIMNSQDIVDSMVKKFDLAKHYDINPDYKYFKAALYDTYHEHVSISKTPYESVRIEVKDHNPDTASMMVSALLNFYDQKIAYLHKTKSLEVIDMYERQLALKRATLDSLKLELYRLGTEQGLIEYESTSREIMKGYLGTVDGSNGDNVNKKEVERLKKNMEKGSGKLIELRQMIEREAAAYVQVKLDYEMAQRFYNSNLTYSNIISSPYPADKKAYPIRWLIVAISTLAAFVMSLLVIYLIETKKK
jgi:capsular polysaccharide biosynthesis protein